MSTATASTALTAARLVDVPCHLESVGDSDVRLGARSLRDSLGVEGSSSPITSSSQTLQRDSAGCADRQVHTFYTGTSRVSMARVKRVVGCHP